MNLSEKLFGHLNDRPPKGSRGWMTPVATDVHIYALVWKVTGVRISSSLFRLKATQ